MNNTNYKQVLWYSLLGLVLFGGGFYIGAERSRVVTPEGFDMSLFWKASEILDEKFVPASTSTPLITEKEKLWGAIQGLTDSYKDPYTVFFPPVESKIFEEEIAGSFGGVGMEIGAEEGVLTVIAPLKGTPADRAGILAGDKIILIGEVSALELNSEEAIKLIRGEVGTSVTITFKREGVAEPLVKTLIREEIKIPTVNTKLLPEDVFVIELYNFSANSPALFRGALREFVESGSDKLVIDLRNNPGGYLEAALDMASWFLPAGKVVATEDFGDKKEKREYKSKGYDIFTSRLKMAILINGGSASASEILAGALREYNKAVLVGEKTFGKGSVQELVPITDDTSLKVTVAHWLTPLGNSISEGGLTPDIEVKLTPENVKNKIDPQLEAAVKYLLGK